MSSIVRTSIAFSPLVVFALANVSLAEPIKPFDHEWRIVITEIMYDPASKEDKGQTEWVEIANLGSETIEIKDWRLDDEDRDEWGTFSCTIEPAGVVVLINGDVISESDFRAAWDGVTSEMPAPGSPSKPMYQVIPMKWGSLANSPTDENEVLRLLDEHDDIVCEVNFKKGGDWPDNKPSGASIWLTDLTATNLNLGELWTRSEAGKDGGRAVTTTPMFDGADVGSPGYVHGLSAPVKDDDKKESDKPEEPKPVDPAPETEQPEGDPAPDDSDN